MSSLLSLALSNAVVASVIAVLVAVVAPFCRRPGVRHALWLLVLLKLVTPPLLPISVAWPIRAAIIERTEPSLPDDEDADFGAATVTERLAAPLPNGRGSDDFETAATPEMPDPSLPDGRGSDLSLVLLVIWLGGALMWWTIAALRLRRFQRLLRHSPFAPPEVQEQARRLAALLGLRRCPPVVFVSAPLSPMLWALGWSPRLLAPAQLWQRLTTEQQDTLLAHELAHLRRGDHWIRCLELMVLGLYWWHPVVWWARRRLQEAEEECCDALVVAVLPEAAPAYASALVQTVAFLSQSRAGTPLGASGVGHVPLLKRRLTMILMANSPRRPSRLAFWTVIGLGALLLPLAPQAAQPQPSEEPKTEKPKSQPLAVDFVQPVTTRFRTADSIWSKPTAGKETDRNEEIEKLQDEIELLKVRVVAKEARIEASKKLLEEYKRRLESYRQINRATPRTIPTDTFQEVQIAVTTHDGQLKIYEAELQEHLLRIKQAVRRLARLRESKPSADTPIQTSWNTTWSEALFEKRSHDMGSVQQGGIVETRFVMTNHGQRPVHIASVRSSAGCLTATASSRDLPPGKSAVIQAKLDTGRFTGSKAFTIYVEFDKPDRQKVALGVTADSRTGGAAKPQSPERLRELEKKLDALQKEMEKLRREMSPDKSP